MADYVLERGLWLSRPRAEVFAFFADVRNLARIHPTSLRLRWLAPPPETLAAGAVVDFSMRMFGWPVRWRVLIREFDPPFRFVDVEIWGPFARWEHRHRFLERGETKGAEQAPGTWIEDRVTYRLPLGLLGRLGHAVGARRRIAQVFDHRDARLREIFSAAGAQDAPRVRQ
jgi:ligand-binding SRPBCC domain-containing protein